MPEIGIALSDEERLKRLRGAPLSPMPTPAPQQVKQEKGAGQQMVDLASSSVMNKASDKYIEPMIQKGFDKVAGMFTPAAAPIAQAGTGMSPGMAQAIIGSGSQAAPLVANQAGALMPAALKGGSAAAAGAAGTGTMAAMMASPLAPIALGLLAGKAFKLFSDGGKVGPLYSAEGDKVDASQAILNSILEQKKKKEENKNKSFLDLLAGSESVDYKANGGMTGLRSANPNAQQLAYSPGFRAMPTALAPIGPGRLQTKNYNIAIPTYNPYVAPSAAAPGATASGDGRDNDYSPHHDGGGSHGNWNGDDGTGGYGGTDSGVTGYGDGDSDWGDAGNDSGGK